MVARARIATAWFPVGACFCSCSRLEQFTAWRHYDFSHHDGGRRPAVSYMPSSHAPSMPHTKWSPARSRHRCIIDFSVTYAGEQHRPATGHVNGFQWAANPPKLALPLVQSSPKGEKICYPQVYHAAKLIALHQPTPKVSISNILRTHTQLQTVNDISATSHQHCGDKNTESDSVMQVNSQEMRCQMSGWREMTSAIHCVTDLLTINLHDTVTFSFYWPQYHGR